MPIISLQYEDLELLTRANKETIIEKIPMYGSDIERTNKDTIDIEFFPDRPDLYSVEGVSRAMRGFLDIETGLSKYTVKQSNVKIIKDAGIDEIRPHIACAIVRNIDFNSNSIKSLMDLQEHLHWGLGRNRKKVSIGVHDLSNITPPFNYITVDGKFEFIPLDFTESMPIKEILKKHPKGIKFAHIVKKQKSKKSKQCGKACFCYPLIIDLKGVVLSFPPIINGTVTRVTEDTKELFIDVTGTSKKEVSVALNIVVTTLAERGGTIESVTVRDSYGEKEITPNLSPTVANIELKEVKSLLGMELTKEECVSQLKRMRYGANVIEGDEIEVQIPAYRADIFDSCDIIEDIAIGYGFESIKPMLPKTSTIGKEHSISSLMGLVREIMAGLGFMGVMPFTLTNKNIHFEKMCRLETDDMVHLIHPISEDQTMLRTMIMPNLMEILSLNQHRELPQNIFEVGEVVRNGVNYRSVSAISIHPQANFTEISEIVNAFLREMDFEYVLSKSSDAAFIEGRRADIFIDGKKQGVMGELHPEVITNFGLGQPIIGFEIDL